MGMHLTEARMLCHGCERRSAYEIVFEETHEYIDLCRECAADLCALLQKRPNPDGTEQEEVKGER